MGQLYYWNPQTESEEAGGAMDMQGLTAMFNEYTMAKTLKTLKLRE